MSGGGAGDCEENKIFKDIASSGMRSGKGDDDRTVNRKNFGDEFDRIFGKKEKFRPKKTKIIYHADGTKTEIIRKF